MTGPTHPTSEQASRQATDWLILLGEAPGDADIRRRFEDWRRASPVNAAAWDATQRTMEAIGRATPDHAHDWRPFLEMRRGAPVVMPSGDANGSRRRIGRRQALQFGGVAVAASAIGLLFGPRALLDMRADYSTGTGETRALQLSDASMVTLAPDSAVSLVYGEAERHVRLLAGRAFFEVARDRTRPFRVSADGVDTTVLGTRFEVARDDHGAAIGVAHGVVRVDYADTVSPVSETLTAGQSVRVAWSGGARRGERPAEQVAAWRHSQLIAQDEPLGAVVDQLRHYYAGAIVLTDRALARRPVTGVYNLSDPVNALRGIARAQNATVRRITPWLLVISSS